MQDHGNMKVRRWKMEDRKMEDQISCEVRRRKMEDHLLTSPQIWSSIFRLLTFGIIGPAFSGPPIPGPPFSAPPLTEGYEEFSVCPMDTQDKNDRSMKIKGADR